MVSGRLENEEPVVLTIKYGGPILRTADEVGKSFALSQRLSPRDP